MTMTKCEITDAMLRAAIAAMAPDRIQGYSTPREDRRSWGAPYYVYDAGRASGEREIWRGNDRAEMLERCEMERLRIGIAAALQAREAANG